MSGIDLAVLDIAGTTVQEHGAVYRVLEEALRDAGASVGPAEVARWMGADKRESIRTLLAEDGGRPDERLVERVHDDFRGRLERAYDERPPAPLDGVPEALAALRSGGARVVLTTGFDREITDDVLRRVGWADGVVDGVVCADDVPAGRPAPYMIFRALEMTGVQRLAATLVAGDTVRDLEAGANARAGWIVGVLTGGSDAGTLARAPHTHLLAGVGEIPSLVAAA